jgi:hypothetical protein
MSGRTERDYRKVFKKIIEIIGGEADCCIEELVTDFERAIWRGAIWLCFSLVPSSLPESQNFGISKFCRIV